MRDDVTCSCLCLQERPEKMLFDDVLQKVGEFGPYQIGLYCLLGLAGLPAGESQDSAPCRERVDPGLIQG